MYSVLFDYMDGTYPTVFSISGSEDGDVFLAAQNCAFAIVPMCLHDDLTAGAEDLTMMGVFNAIVAPRVDSDFWKSYAPKNLNGIVPGNSILCYGIPNYWEHVTSTTLIEDPELASDDIEMCVFALEVDTDTLSPRPDDISFLFMNQFRRVAQIILGKCAPSKNIDKHLLQYIADHIPKEYPTERLQDLIIYGFEFTEQEKEYLQKVLFKDFSGDIYITELNDWE